MADDVQTPAKPAVSAITPVPLSLYDQDFGAFAQALGASFERYGFAVISELFDHPRLGIEKANVERALDAAKAFFALPEAFKKAYHTPGQGGQRGYTPFGIETAKGMTHHDLKEFWHMGRELPDAHPYREVMPDNVWPHEVPAFRPEVEAMYNGLDHLGKHVLHAIATYLKLDKDFFSPAVREGNSVLRLLHYPPVTNPGESVRAGAHGDINVITLLMGAEEPGLQLQDRDGTWLPITPPEGCIVINIGDMLSRLTNNVLPSTIHRVVNPADSRKGFARYSTPFFLHFEPPYEIRTLPSCITTERPNAFPQPITAEDFLQQRLREIKLA
jgi:isopenicillin N synthase-like dioxygenase